MLSGTAAVVAPAAPVLDADRVSSDLLALYAKSLPMMSTAALTAAGFAEGTTASVIQEESGIVPLMTDPQGRVAVVVTAVDPSALLPALSSAGMAVAASLPSYHRIEGFIPLSSLPALSQLGGSGLLGISSVPMPKTYTGSGESQADNVLEADRVRASTPGYNGSGVKIGVLSDSYDKSSLVTHAAASISSGNLPSNVQVLQDFNSTGYSNQVEDEGRAMLELIYDLSPGSGLGFATADRSESGFAGNIRALAGDGYKVIVDDVAYYDEPYFQDGIVAQAVDDVEAGGASYFSAAGNEGDVSYDSASPAAYGTNPPSFVAQAFSPIDGDASSYYDWDAGPGIDTQMSVTIPRNSSLNLNFEWDQPFYTTGGVTTNLDFYLLSTNTATGVQTIRARVETDNVATQTPESLLGYTNTLSGADATSTFAIVVRNTNGGPVPGRIKFIDEFEDAAVTYNDYFTHSPTVVGHAAAAGAEAVGAAPFYAQTTPEDFSSEGPSTILFNADGTRKSAPEVRAKPDILSIDGADTSFFLPGDDIDGNGLDNFFGTSAAAPHAAAVAALVLQANPTFTPAQVYARLESTADPTIGNGDPDVIGAGLIDAYRAVFGSPVAATPKIADGFETGALGTDWTVYKSGSGLTQVTTALAPAGGADQLVLGQNLGFASTGFNSPGLNEAILHANLAGQAGVVLSFSEKKFSNESDSPMPASFAGHGNFDGVAFSVDGIHWDRLLSLAGANSTTSYQTLSVNIGAAAANLGLTLTADTLIKFQEYDDTSNAIGVSGIALDNVLLTKQSRVSGVVIDDGTAQRSRIRSLTVNFSGNVASAPASAFSLTRTSGGAIIPVAVSLTHPSSGVTRAVLTFSGPTLDSGSLSDGRYVLTLNGSAMLDDSGREVDVDGDGTDGGTRTVSFFRFFGDSNGHGVVDAADYLVFVAAYRSGNASGTNSAYDFNGDGVINATDMNAFLIRYNQRRLP